MTPNADDARPLSTERVAGLGLAYAVLSTVQAGLSFVLLPIIATALGGPLEYGELTAALIVVQLGTTVAAAGLPAAIGRMYFDVSGPAIARWLILVVIVASIAFAGLMWLTGPLWSSVFNELDFAGALRIAPLAIPPAVTVFAVLAFLRCTGSFGRYAIVSLLGTVVAQLSGLLALTVSQSATSYLVGYTLGLLVGALLGLIAARVWAERRSVAGTVSQALRLGLPTVPHTAGLFLLLAGDRVVVERLEGLEAAGRYQLAYVTASLPMVVLVAYNSAWAPAVYARQGFDQTAFLSRTRELLLLGLASLAVGVVLVLPPVLSYIVDDVAYRVDDLRLVIGLVAFASIPYLEYLTAVHVLFAAKSTVSLALITPLVAVATLGLSVVAVNEMGLEGAAAVTVLSYIALALLTRRVASRHAPVPDLAPRSFLTWSVAGLAVGAATQLPTNAIVVRAALAGLVVVLCVVLMKRSIGDVVPVSIPTRLDRDDGHEY